MSDLFSGGINQLDRIEAKLDRLLEKRKPTKPKSAKFNVYDDKFLSIWLDYPSMSGANKAKAYSAYKKRLSETKQPLQLSVNIHMAVIKYAKFCKATNRYVMLPSTFFGPARHYNDNWNVPVVADTAPTDNQKLQGWAESKGLRTPRPGESWDMYRRAVTQLYRPAQ